MTRGRAVLVAVLLATVTTGTGYVVAAGTGDASAGATALGPGIVTVQVRINHSRFDIDDLRVRAGTLVRFVVRNDDPINHEFVVGAESVHARHRTGDESVHPPVPGEVSVGPGETGETVFSFVTPGEVTFACHLRGHVAFGMVGTITVDPAATRNHRTPA